MFEYLEKESGGDVIEKTPELYISNQRIDEIHYLNVPYPIFLRVNNQYICIGVGFRINQKVEIYSPFFAKQGENLWRLVQSHVTQAVLNDFNVRTHLGVYHFTTNQYHVPVYKCLSKLHKNSPQKDNFMRFIDHSYGMFSKGLEGVNVAATASLVHPVEKYSLVNKALNVTQATAIKIIANTSNNLKIYDLNPETILANQGHSKEEIQKYFPKLAFDLELYAILSDYIEKVYLAFSIGEIEDKLFNEINEQTKFMGVGG